METEVQWWLSEDGRKKNRQLLFSEYSLVLQDEKSSRYWLHSNVTALRMTELNAEKVFKMANFMLYVFQHN
jgi:hypothetical protein